MLDKIVNALLPNARQGLQQMGRSLGLEIRASGPAARDDLRLVKFLVDQKINLLLDVGANKGQFAEGIFAAGYSQKIISFEALPSAHAILKRKAENKGKDWMVAPAVALSNETGETEFNLNDSDATSSLLSASERSIEVIDGVRPKQILRVPTQPLDDFDTVENFGEHRTFLKIDVQGGEGLVLGGASKTLKKVIGLVIELSFTEIYSGQPMAMDIIADLMNSGYEVHDIVPVYREPESYRLLQIDVVMFHPDRTLEQNSTVKSAKWRA